MRRTPWQSEILIVKCYSLEYFLLSLTTYIILSIYLLLTETTSLTKRYKVDLRLFITGILFRLLERVFVIFTIILCCSSLYVFILTVIYDIEEFNYSV